MVKSMRISVILIWLGILSSCVGHRGTMTDLFQVSAYGLDSIININTDSLRSPYAMEYQNDTYIFCDIHNDKFLSLFNEDGKLLGELAPRGNGPDEFVHIGKVSLVGDNVCLWDMGKTAWSYLKVDYRDISSSTICKTIKIKEGEELLSAFQSTPIEDSCFVVAGIVKDHRFAIVNKSGDLVCTFGDYPKGYDEHNTDAENGFIYQGPMAYQEEKKVFVRACSLGETICFYDLNDVLHPCLLKEYTFSHPKFERNSNPKESVIFHHDNNVGFVEIKPSTDYCVCLYSGEQKDLRDYSGDKLLLFDWQGEPKKLIYLKRRYTSMAVDNEHHRVILLGTDAETGDYLLSEVAL